MKSTNHRKGRSKANTSRRNHHGSSKGGGGRHEAKGGSGGRGFLSKKDILGLFIGGFTFLLFGRSLLHGIRVLGGTGMEPSDSIPSSTAAVIENDKETEASFVY